MSLASLSQKNNEDDYNSEEEDVSDRTNTMVSMRERVEEVLKR